MAFIKSFRDNDSALKEWETLLPIVNQCRSVIRFWWLSTIYFWITGIGILILAGKFESLITPITIVFLINFLIWIGVYARNNTKNWSLIASLKDYSSIREVDLLRRSYVRFLGFMRFLALIDIFLFPVTFPLKFVGSCFYLSFKRKVKKLKKMIIKGETIFIPDEDEIAKDPFYSFLQREGLYDSEKDIEFDVELDEEKLNEMSSEESKEEESKEEESNA